MSYYTLPRKQNICKVRPSYGEQIEPFISFSLLYYLKKIKEQIVFLKKKYELDNSGCNIDLIYKVVNPYEFVHCKVPGSKFSVSKVKAASQIFYTFMEIINSFNIFESFIDRNIKSLHVGENNSATIDCMNIFRENNTDINYEYTLDPLIFKPIPGIDNMTIDFLYFELQDSFDNESDDSRYLIGIVNILCYILSYQNVSGICVIKLDSLYLKPIVDVVYLLTSMYEKVYIIKPNVSNILKNERFIICKNFTSDYSKTIENNNILRILKNVFIEFNNGKKLNSIIENDLPYYFLNKIEESNIIIGQQQLEHLDHVINTIKNKNRDNKIETLKKNNIQKSIQWCEKNKIPCNKFVDKLNIFLPVTTQYNNNENNEKTE
jgi:hypothetical protein